MDELRIAKIKALMKKLYVDVRSDLSMDIVVLFELGTAAGYERFTETAERCYKLISANKRSRNRHAKRMFAQSCGYSKWNEIPDAVLLAIPATNELQPYAFVFVLLRHQQRENAKAGAERQAIAADRAERQARSQARLQAAQDQADAAARDEYLAEVETCRHPEIKTKKEARRLGFLTLEELTSYHRATKRRPMVPREGEEPIGIKDQLFWHVSQCELLLSVTEGRRNGLELIEGSEPETYRHAHFGKAITYATYRESAFRAVARS